MDNQMKIYSYSKYTLGMQNVLKVLVFAIQLLLLPLTLFMGWGLFKEGHSIPFIIGTMSLFAFLMWFSLNSAVLFQVEVGTDDGALYIKHYWHWLRIPWENVIAIKPLWYSVFRPNDQDFIVFAQKLPLIFWVIALLSAFTFQPGFVITRSIENKHPLITKINQKINQNQKRLKYNTPPINN